METVMMLLLSGKSYIAEAQLLYFCLLFLIAICSQSESAVVGKQHARWGWTGWSTISSCSYINLQQIFLWSPGLKTSLMFSP